MELTHEFTVPATLEETWAAFDDIASVGECFPGAQVTDVDGDSFSGTVKVKLGPIALVYKGTGTFLEKDEAARTMTIQAKGKDKRGNGTAGADVVARMEAVGGTDDPATRVTVRTDLAITGKPAQFGRGVMQDVSDKLLGQFVDCLAARLGPDGGGEAVDQDAGPASVPSGAAAGSGAAGSNGDGPADPAPRRTSSGGDHRAASSDDAALDLGATVLPVLLRSYGPQLAGGLVALLVLRWLLRRRR